MMRTAEEWAVYFAEHVGVQLPDFIRAIQADALETAAIRVDGFGMSTTCVVVGQAVRQLKPPDPAPEAPRRG